MKKARYTEEQIAFALRQAETGTAVAEVIRKMGISEQTFYRWKKLYAGMGVAELRRLKQLEEEKFRGISYRQQAEAAIPAAVVEEICAELRERADTAIDQTLAALPPEFPKPLAESITGGMRTRLRMIFAD
jgi:putative transposase